MGFEVVIGPTVLAADPAERSARARADELNGFLRDAKVRAIVAAIGGYNSNAVLDLVDWQRLREDPKIIVGYSDITALLLGVVATGVVAFHGPTVLPEFAEFPSVQDYTRDWFLRVTSKAEPAGPLSQPQQWTEEFLAWGERDTRPREMLPTRPPVWLGTGAATGPLLGGNLETLCALAGTRYLPDMKGAVLLLETASTLLPLIERGLDQLAMLGVLDNSAAILAGHSFRGGERFEEHWQERLRERFAASGKPMVLGLHLGHTDPMPTLPLGVLVTVDTAGQRVEVAGAAVR
jgi:muramoyltetrapeptide carboxypeptidase LdcA involved in peptidoglycan recycling